uniref:Uncharacterized protein n=1 Tax=Schizaphis graminum TaxID=13262 RepID=A0A2S2NLY9_SCHGA
MCNFQQKVGIYIFKISICSWKTVAFLPHWLLIMRDIEISYWYERKMTEWATAVALTVVEDIIQTDRQTVTTVVIIGVDVSSSFSSNFPLCSFIISACRWTTFCQQPKAGMFREVHPYRPAVISFITLCVGCCLILIQYVVVDSGLAMLKLMCAAPTLGFFLRRYQLNVHQFRPRS